MDDGYVDLAKVLNIITVNKYTTDNHHLTLSYPHLIHSTPSPIIQPISDDTKYHISLSSLILRSYHQLFLLLPLLLPLRDHRVLSIRHHIGCPRLTPKDTILFHINTLHYPLNTFIFSDSSHLLKEPSILLFKLLFIFMDIDMFRFLYFFLYTFIV